MSLRSFINVTPLIDVMLVLLIIFMIVTPFLANGQIVVPRSANPDSRPEDRNEVRLGIDREGVFRLDQGSGMTRVGDEDLARRLKEIYSTRTKDRVMFLRADQNIEFGRVQQAIEIARQAGVRVVGAITEQKQTLIKKKEGG